MIVFRKIPLGLTASILLAGSLMVAGCSDDTFATDESGVYEGELTEVTLSLSVRGGDDTTADGTPSDPASDQEKINSWWIAFVDSRGTVRNIVTRQTSGVVEMETFKCTVPPGLYTLYAFANISPDELKSACGLTFNIDETIKTSDVENAVWTATLNDWDAEKPIPMSGFLKNVRVRNIAEETFSIEVVRMMAKMEFIFSNPGDKAIKINAISLDPVTTSGVSLFPKGAGGIAYTHLGISAYTPLEGATYGSVSFPLASDNIVAAGEAEKSRTIYLQESLSNRENNQAFTIGLNVSHEEGISEFQQYNITRDIVAYINRNDHIVIPVALSQYDVDVQAVFYPPIGGYPAVASALDPEGSQIFTFSSGGDFAIVPHVTDKQTGGHLSPVYYSVSVSEISDPYKIFSSGPAVTSGSQALPDEVTGILSGANKGKASLKISVAIYDHPRYQDGADPIVYTRTIYIIRD